MSQKSRKKDIPGVSREEEMETLSEILDIAEANLERTRASVELLAQELNELKEVYDVEDKEGLAQWFNTDARFKQSRQELLRAQRSRKKPYFGRIDFTDTNRKKQECYYIGKAVIAEDAAEPRVIDWRAPVASVYYEKSIGRCTYSVKGEGAFEIDLSRKRTYEIEDDKLKDFYDSDVVANDELLTKYLARNKRAVLSDIIATIQQEQNEVIRKKPQHNMIIQGGAGSGKTTVAMHRISYILYNYDLEFQPGDFYIIGSNRILLNYITGILPDLDVYGVSQMTMEQLFIRLLYEDWDKHKYTVKRLDKGDSSACIKGSQAWFRDLEDYCLRYEWRSLPREDVVIEKTNRLIMERGEIVKVFKRFQKLSFQEKKEKLTEYLMAKVENEIYGRYYSYPPEEQKRLTRFYQTYFGKKEWKGSIFELYEDFLREQNEKGKKAACPGTEFDLYDLAALAYLYKRIKETEVIQEASHVVIDEAQDFGMMAYGALQYCLSKCTYTIMGDVSQNIYFGYGLQDWEELRRLMLPGEFDYFGILRKSYRNTVEISEFAANILQHGSFPVYPVEPIIRHGEEVRVSKCGEKDLIAEAAAAIDGWRQQRYETIAVICRDEEEAARVSEKLRERVELWEFNAETEEFGNGVMVLPIEYSKGLEFDAVLLFNANDRNYPLEDGYAKQLYVAATRALHELAVLYSGKLTDLIALPVPEEHKKRFLIKDDRSAAKKQRRVFPEEEPKTNRELQLQRAMEGHREMEERNYIGPRRIVTPKMRGAAQQTQERIRQETVVCAKEPQRSTEAKAVIAAGHTDTDVRREPCEFGGLPATTSLRPIGHSNIPLSARWVSSNKKYVEITTAYGILRITPIADDTVRVTFSRTSIDKLSDLPPELSPGPSVKWKCMEARDRVEIITQRLLLQVDKKSGAVSYYTGGGVLLLAENHKFPRQLENTSRKQTWTYFDWDRKEVLKARGIHDRDWIELNATAKYISFGEKSCRPACILSNNGYQLLVPPGRKVMICTIPSYGSYLYTEGVPVIDYFFRTAL